MATEYPTPPAASPEPYGPPPPPRRLSRSSREHMWAGVAGGIAEYFELDPSLVRLMWVAATIVSGGLAIPLYILAWIILPRDDRSAYSGRHGWRDWSHEVQAEAHHLADEARRVADDVAGASHAAAGRARPAVPPTEPDWWRSERYVDRQRAGRNPRAAGTVLIVLGVLLLAANAGLFSFVDWKTIWPIIFIGFGVVLLARQSGWNR